MPRGVSESQPIHHQLGAAQVLDQQHTQPFWGTRSSKVPAPCSLAKTSAAFFYLVLSCSATLTLQLPYHGSRRHHQLASELTSARQLSLCWPRSHRIFPHVHGIMSLFISKPSGFLSKCKAKVPLSTSVLTSTLIWANTAARDSASTYCKHLQSLLWSLCTLFPSADYTTCNKVVLDQGLKFIISLSLSVMWCVCV